MKKIAIYLYISRKISDMLEINPLANLSELNVQNWTLETKLEICQTLLTYANQLTFQNNPQIYYTKLSCS